MHSLCPRLQYCSVLTCESYFLTWTWCCAGTSKRKEVPTGWEVTAIFKNHHGNDKPYDLQWKQGCSCKAVSKIQCLLQPGVDYQDHLWTLWQRKLASWMFEHVRETPQLVRNFRILWASLPRTSRHEMLIKLLRETSNTTFRFLGIAVCQKAFQLMTGVSSNVLQKARQACQKNQVTHLARAELGQWMEIRNAPRAPRYLVPWRL